MKTTIFVILVLILSSCLPEDPRGNKYDLTSIETPPESQFSEPGGQTINCFTEGSNCWQFIEPGTTVNYPPALTEFYSSYYSNSITSFFNNYNWLELFPSGSLTSTEVELIINGTYGVQVMADSSIVVYSNPSAGLQTENVIFAWDRDK